METQSQLTKTRQKTKRNQVYSSIAETRNLDSKLTTYTAQTQATAAITVSRSTWAIGNSNVGVENRDGVAKNPTSERPAFHAAGWSRAPLAVSGGASKVRRVQHNSAPRGGPQLELGPFRLKTWYIIDFQMDDTQPSWVILSVITFTTKLLDEPWSQVSSLPPPPGTCLYFLCRALGFSIPTARRV